MYTEFWPRNVLQSGQLEGRKRNCRMILKCISRRWEPDGSSSGTLPMAGPWC